VDAERTEWVTDRDRFQLLSDAWEGIARTDPTPFSSHAWFSSWWRAFHGPRSLSVCARWRGNELSAAIALCRRGARLEAMVNDHSPRFQVLALEPSALDAAAAVAFEARPSELAVGALPEDDRTLGALRSAAADSGYASLVIPSHCSPLVGTTGDFQDYRAERKHRWRELERRRRKMERDHEVEYRLIARPTDLDRELHEGLEVEASGWKGRVGTAILSSPSALNFYTSIANAFDARGELRLSSIRVDGELAAFDLSLVRHRHLYLLKTAYRDSLRRLGPGLALRLAVIERCFQQDIDAHEFLGENAEWKGLFATGERRHSEIRCYRRHPLPITRYAYRRVLRPRLKLVRVRAREALGRPRRR
jgi:CelD/BcsL family acetyltransferase involved in cellulose biosynthesis